MSLGLLASYVWSQVAVRRRLGPLSGLALAIMLFAAIELFFLAFTSVMAPSLTEAFGIGRIAAANLLAALAMSSVVLARPFRS